MNSFSPSPRPNAYGLVSRLVFNEEVSVAVLNSLSDHIAVLDSEGTIVAVNDAWNNFAMKHGVMEHARVGAGINYFQACRAAIAERDRQAQLAAEGIQAVLSGKAPAFRCEYIFPSEHGDLWFEMSVCPLRARRRGAVVIHSDITQRKQAQLAVAENEKRFRVLTDNAPVLIWISDEQGKCSHFNHQWLVFTGRSLEQELADGWLEGVHPADRDFCMNTYLNAFRERQPFAMEYRLRNAGGQYRWVLDQGVPYFSPQGNFKGYLGSAVDVTERRAAQQAVEQESAYLKLLLDLLLAVNEARSPAKAFQACLDHICAIMKWPLGHVYFRSSDARRRLRSSLAWHVRDRVRYAPLMRITEETALPPGSELPGMAVLSRKPMWARTVGGRAQFPRGAVASHLGIQSALAVPVQSGDEVAFVMEFGLETSTRPDPKVFTIMSTIASQVGRILEGKKARQELELSERRYRAFFEKTTVGAGQTTLSGQFIKANDALCRITGYSRRELLRKKFMDLTHAADQHADAAFQQLISGETDSHKTRKRIIRKDGTTIWVQVDAGIVRSVSGRPVHAVVVIQDITKGKQAEESLLHAHNELKELAARLIAAQEEERARIGRELHDGTSQLVAALSLDVTNIRESLPDQAIEAGRGLSRLKQRIFRLATNVRELSHELHPAVLEHAGLAAALQSFCAEFRTREKIKVGLKIGTVPTLKNPQAALSLYRIVQEGMQNIRKHARVKEAEVELTSVKDRLMLRIRDRGAGFNPAAARNSGLGLTSIQERVRLLGGRLEINSAPGRGTELLIEVPNSKNVSRQKLPPLRAAH